MKDMKKQTTEELSRKCAVEKAALLALQKEECAKKMEKMTGDHKSNTSE